MTAATLPGLAEHPTSPKRLHVEVLTKHTAAIYGGRLTRLCDRAEVPRMWSPVYRTWLIPRRRVDDLLVVAEHVEKRFATVTTAIDL